MTQNQILTVGRATNRSSHGRRLPDLKTKAPRDASERVRRPIPGLAARLYVLVRLSVLNPERRPGDFWRRLAIFGILGFYIESSCLVRGRDFDLNTRASGSNPASESDKTVNPRCKNPQNSKTRDQP
jgi:hypothetical protein